MSQLFISSVEANDACVKTLQQELEAEGFVVWEASGNFTPEQISYRRERESGVRGSVALILVWSKETSGSEQMVLDIAHAIRLQVPVIPIVLDSTALPSTIADPEPVVVEGDCDSVMPAIQRRLSTEIEGEELGETVKQLSHEYIRERRAGIKRAEGLLEQEQHTEGLLARLEDIVDNDLIPSLKEEAQRVIDRFGQQAEQHTPSQQSRHVFGVRCSNGHISYFDKRVVCGEHDTVVRKFKQTQKELDRLRLPCKTNGCNEEVMVEIDCEGYK